MYRSNSWNLWICSVTRQGGIKIISGIKVANHLTLNERYYLDLSTWTQCNHKDSKMGKREVEESEKERNGIMGKTGLAIANFED